MEFTKIEIVERPDFIRKVEYSFYIPEILNKFENRFDGLKILKIKIIESHYFDGYIAKKALTEFNESGESGSLEIEFTSHIVKGNIKFSCPEVVFTNLEVALETAAKEYSKLFHP